MIKHNVVFVAQKKMSMRYKWATVALEHLIKVGEAHQYLPSRVKQPCKQDGLLFALIVSVLIRIAVGMADACLHHAFYITCTRSHHTSCTIYYVLKKMFNYEPSLHEN